MNHFDAHLLYIDEGVFDTAAETLFGGWEGVEEVIDETLDVDKESPVSNDIISFAKLAEEGLTMSVNIDEESPFIKEIQNQHKKYLRDKAQYKFWKDQEFIGNNRAGKRLKAHEHHGRRK